MTDEEARAALDALIQEQAEDYASLSRLIGRNPAYIQQYVKRGTPRRLAEADRRDLAKYFRVPEATLGGPPVRELRIVGAGRGTDRRGADLVAVARRQVGASAGPGALARDEGPAAEMLFPPALLRDLGAGRPEKLSLIRVEGESMLPTLGHGDDIMVDESDGAGLLRDGIYVLRVGDALIVKRVALGPGGGLSILSDNPQGAQWENVDRAALAVIGRVIWAGRRLR